MTRAVLEDLLNVVLGPSAASHCWDGDEVCIAIRAGARESASRLVPDVDGLYHLGGLQWRFSRVATCAECMATGHQQLAGSEGSR